MTARITSFGVTPGASSPVTVTAIVFGGPSTRSVSADDAIWHPINGFSLQDYAELARDAQARGINDEAGMITLAM